MIIELVRKERIFRQEAKSKSKVANVFSYILKFVFIALCIALECFIFYSVNQKIEKYSEYGTFDFLVLFLFVIMLVDIVGAIVKARNVLFNQYDNQILFPLPVSVGEIIFSKIVYIFLNEVLTHLIISTPILITYGALNTQIPYFYVFSLIYPILISLFSIGVVLILVVPYQFFYKVIKLSDIAQFVLGTGLMIALCFAYQYVLNLFLNALNNSAIGGVFDKNFIESLHSSVIYLAPNYYIFDSVINGNNTLLSWCILLGSILISLSLGTFISSYAYINLSKNEFDIKLKKERNKVKVDPIYKALFKKEIALIFKDSNNLFSYSSLLIMAPFLSFLVISSLNAIMYSNLSQYLSFFPDLVKGINICLILLFSSVINGSAVLSLSREGKALQIVKYLPVPLKKQIGVKAIIPIALSSISLLFTTFTLSIGGVVDWLTSMTTLLLGVMIIFATNAYGIYFDMYDRGIHRIKLSWITSLISIGTPFIIFIIQISLALANMNTYLNYFILILVTLLIFVPFIFVRMKKLRKVYNKMEVN